MTRVLTLLIFLIQTNPAWAVDYYFATAGSDGAAGTSSGAPWQTNDKLYNLTQNLSGLTLNCGDRIFLNRGDTWTASDSTDSMYFLNRACTSTTKIVVDAYGTGADPIFSGGSQTNNWGLRIGGSSWIEVKQIDFRSWMKIQVEASSSNILLSGISSRSMRNECIRINGGTTNNVIVEDSTVVTCGNGGANGEGFYIGTNNFDNSPMNNITIRRNDVSATTHESIEVKSSVPNTIIEYNYIHDSALTAGGPGGISVAASATDTIIRNNRIKNITGAGGKGIFLKGSGQMIGNVIDTVGAIGIDYQNTGPNPSRIISHNTVYAATGAGTSGSGSNTRLSSNIIWSSGSGNDASDPLFVNQAAGNFALTASSPAIDTGTSCDRAFNGTTCDKGAHETITIASAEVGLVNATTTILTFNNNLNPPLLPAATCTGFTREEENPALTWNTLAISSCDRQGTNQIILVHATATTARAQRVSYSTSTGNVTDSALIGNSLNQRLNAVINQTVTNNIGGGAPTFVLELSHSQCFGIPLVGIGVLETRPKSAAVSQRCYVVKGGSVVVAAQVTCTIANCPTTGVKWQVKKNAEAYADVADLITTGAYILNLTGGRITLAGGGGSVLSVTSTANEVGFTGTLTFLGSEYPQQGFQIPECLDDTGLTPDMGSLNRTSAAVPTFQLNQDRCITLAAMMTFSESTGPAVYQFKVINQDNTDLDAVVPVVAELTDYTAGAGF